MLYRFKARNTGDVVMLEPNGRQLLEIIGKDPGPKGIVLAAQMPAAMAALEAAIARDEAEERERQAEAERKAKAGEAVSINPPPGVTLRHRALPLMQMMAFCHRQGDDIVWGV